MEVLKLRIDQTILGQTTIQVEEANPTSTPPESWRISVEKPGVGRACEPFQASGTRLSIDLPVDCEAGIEHRVIVEGLRRLGEGDSTDGYMVVSKGERSFISEKSRSLTDIDLHLTLEQPTFDLATLLINSSTAPSLWQIRLSRRWGGDYCLFRLFHVDGMAERFDIPVSLEPEVEYRAEAKGLIQVGSGSGGGSGSFWVVCQDSVSLSGKARSAVGEYRLHLQLEQTTYRELDLILQTSTSEPTPDLWEVNVNDAGTYLVPGTAKKYRVPGLFDAGLSYFISVRGMVGFSSGRAPVEGYVMPWQQTINFKAELTVDDLRRLRDKAVAMATEAPASKRCAWLYRNKSPDYFDEIFTQRGGIMEALLKDNGGDPGSPINSRTRGLFFMASVDRQSTSGQPIPVSPFGSSRICLPAVELVNKSKNVYFADFYCMKQESAYHYVTLVIARPGSEEDVFCSERLVQLDFTENPFLFVDHSGQLRVTSRSGLLIEVFYTENIDIGNYRSKLVEDIPLIGSGSSTTGGIRKFPFCQLCNLYPRRRRGDNAN